MGFNVVQHGLVQFGGGANGKPAVMAQQSHARQGFGVELPCPGNLKAHEGSPTVVNGPCVGKLLDNVGLSEVEGGQLILRQVEAAVLPILARVAQDVGELQSNSQLHS